MPCKLTAYQKIVVLKHCLLLLLNQTVMCDDKWILYDDQQWPAQWLDWEEAPKHFPKPNLHPNRGSWSLFGVLLLVWSTTSFWILAKPFHLRNVLSKLMRCTENCHLQLALVNRMAPDLLHDDRRLTTFCTPNTSRGERAGLQSFASSTMFTWPLTSRLPLLQASEPLFAGKLPPQPAGGLANAFQVCWILRHGFLCYRNKQNLFLIGKNVLIIMVPILMNKDVFEPSYNDLKFMIRNCNYVCTT